VSRAVIDQPGVRIVAIGLALSLFFGLALKSQISQSRVQQYLDKSIERLQTDFYVDYGSAQVNLSSWGLPLPALVIQAIRLSPKSTICQSSQIYIDELEIPISLGVIFGIDRTLPKLRIKVVELRLADIEKCMNNQGAPVVFSKEVKEDKSKAPVPEATEPTLKNVFKSETPSELKEIYIEKLKVISAKRPDQPVLLRQVNVDLSYAQNHLAEIKIKSKLNAFKDARSDVYFLNANVLADFKAPVTGEIESTLNITGKLLDGDVKLLTHGFSSSKKITYELSVVQVSIRALAPFINSSDLNSVLEKTPVAISLMNKGEIKADSNLSIDSKLNKFILNVDSGVLRVNEVEFGYANKSLYIKPFVLSIEALGLSKFKNIEQFKKKLDSFESLGELSAVLQYKSENSYALKGSIKNIEAIFSNRGRRDLQKIDHVDVELNKKENKTYFTADNFVINNEKISGLLSLQHSDEADETSGQFKISGVVLSNKIWEQFTFVEQSPHVDVVWNYKKKYNEWHSVKLHFDKVGMPGVKLDNLNVELEQVLSAESTGSSLRVNIRPGYLETDSTLLDNKIVNQILNSDKNFQISTLTSTKTNLSLVGSDWKNLNFHLESQFLPDKNIKAETKLDLKGLVKYNGGLSSHLTMTNKLIHSQFELFTGADDELIVRPRE
jgi:hypothetical protein